MAAEVGEHAATGELREDGGAKVCSVGCCPSDAVSPCRHTEFWGQLGNDEVLRKKQHGVQQFVAC